MSRRNNIAEIDKLPKYGMQQLLPLDTFKTVVASTPLVSVDFIIRNSNGKVLLGKRLNRPAKGFWFVPGGRILKGENLQVAVDRLLQEELGLNYAELEFEGIYQHFYEDSFFSENTSTHYVVLAYEIHFDEPLSILPLEQHSKYKWFAVNELIDCEYVHPYTKWYFQPAMQADSQMKSNVIEQSLGIEE